SHAASFALIAYASAYLKCHYLAAFTAALLNNQPMGFYQPATLIKDAQRHGLKVEPIDITRSDWSCTVESGGWNGDWGLGVWGLDEDGGNRDQVAEKSIPYFPNPQLLTLNPQPATPTPAPAPNCQSPAPNPHPPLSVLDFVMSGGFVRTLRKPS